MITKAKIKSKLIRPSGRSTDFITPSFGYGCLYDCSYCYMKRNLDGELKIYTNTSSILTEINNHAFFNTVEKPNQTHPKFVTYDISCNEDFALHLKYHNWKVIFDFFRDHPIAMGSFATKYVNDKLLEYNPNKKIRVRFSLMPQKISSILEPNTSSIQDRIDAIDRFTDAGYDVHVNYSPVVVYNTWLRDYKELFEQVQQIKSKDSVKAEVIFLTHNKKKHEKNLEKNRPGEDLLWTPFNQERKVSQYGGENLRYKSALKAHYIEQFKQLHSEIIPWNTIRYIF